MNQTNILWVYWSKGEMSPQRKKAYKHLINNSKCEINLVTQDNFKEYEVNQSPIPEEFYLLSDTHQSDYARSYLMHHYGGAYSDIKPYDINFKDLISKLTIDNDCWGIGYPYSKRELSTLKSCHNIDDIENGEKYVGFGYFAYKPNTKLTKKWLKLNNTMLKENSDKLNIQPGTFHPRATPGGAYHGSPSSKYPTGYPFYYLQFVGNYQLAQNKFLDHLQTTAPSIHFNIKFYR